MGPPKRVLAFYKVVGYGKCFKNNEVASQMPDITHNLHLAAFRVANNQSQPLLSHIS